MAAIRGRPAMTPGQLRTFIAVVANRSVSRAADSLFVSQAAVSSALASLQAELGVNLVVRDGRNIAITEAGIALYEKAVEVIGLLEDAARVAREAGRQTRRSLRIGAVTTVGEFLLPHWIGGFLAAMPEYDIALEVGNRDRVFDLLASHKVDVVIAGRPRSNALFTTVATRQHSLVLVGAASGKEPDPAASTWLLREEGSGSRQSALEVLAASDFEVPTMTIGSNVAILQAASLGIGVAVVSLDSLIGTGLEFEVNRIDMPGLPISKQWHLVVRTGHEQDAAVQAFVGHLSAAGQISLSS